MNNVERFKNSLRFKPIDRLPVIEWATYWDETIERWHREGLPEKLQSPEEISEHFGLDRCLQSWISPRADTCPQPPHYGAGIIVGENDYDNLKQHLYLGLSFDEDSFEIWAKEQRAGDTVIWLTLEGFFWFPRSLFGIEGHMYAFFDKPDLMKRINTDLLEYNLRMIDKICAICKPTFLTFAEDLSYNHGPMLSKQSFDEFLAPYYKEIVPMLKKMGIVSFVDSDGDVVQIIPWLKEVGIEGILPLERMAGVDVVKIRKEHPDFKMIGAFDKTTMHLGEDAIRKEFERLLPVMRQGGFIPSVDHQTPPDVSLENYICYIGLLKEYAESSVVF